jgi:arylsulfatase A-like enzyme
MKIKQVVLSLSFFFLLNSTWGKTSSKPNILFVFTDDHAPHAIGAYNGWLKSVNPTPVIDKLAKEGMLFVNSFCTNSICGPSRAVIQTGKDNAPGARVQELEIDRHMDLNYDLFVDLTPEFNQPPSQKRQDRSAWHNMKRMTPEQLKAWRDHYAPRDKAFHEANLSGKELVRWKFQRYAKNYLRCVKGVDESVDRLQKELRRLGLDKNTIVIYSSDQGFYIGDHGWYDKRWMYEESLKMPFIVKWPGVVKPGSRNTDLVQNLDYAQTFLEIAGAPQPKDMQGLSLVPLLKGDTKKDWRKEIYYHYYEYPSVHMIPRHYGIRTKRYKLMHFYQFGKEWEMYDLKTDPDELTNIYGNNETIKVQNNLKNRLKKLQKFYGDDSDLSVRPDYIEQYRKKS